MGSIQPASVGIYLTARHTTQQDLKLHVWSGFGT